MRWEWEGGAVLPPSAHARGGKRHRRLVSRSHDHQHALVEARRLRRGAREPEHAAAAASAFVRFFSEETIRQFAEEEELLFPLVAAFDEARPLVAEALVEHQHIQALVLRLRRLLESQDAVDEVMLELGERLESHIRLEERELFPLIERLLGSGGDPSPRSSSARKA